MKTRVFFFVATIAMAAGGMRATTPARAGGCDQVCLKGMLDSYFDALPKHDASKLPTSPSVKFTENGHEITLGEGLWKTASAVTYRLDALDPQSSQAAAEAVISEKGQLANFLVRLKVDGKKISEVETIVCRKGQEEIFGPEKLTVTPPLYTERIPVSQRNRREQLIAAADAYFTAIQTEGSDQYKRAPLAADANRFENGVQTTNVSIPTIGLAATSASEQLDRGVFKGITITHRRYPLVDEEHGIALAIVLMHVPKFGGLLLGEMFKISGGEIRQIQAVMVDQPDDGPTGWK